MQACVAVIDYGAGNIGSVLNIFKKIGAPAVCAKTADDISMASHLLLPGVGAFDYCMGRLRGSPVFPALAKAVIEDKKPLLGICVGFQMLFGGSEEGTLPGLGWLEGDVVTFDREKLPATSKVPHMGWSDISTAPSPLWQGLERPRFYFVHSYHPRPSGTTQVIATCRYGYNFCCAAAKDNIAGVQFHPEKSHRYGMQLLRNFTGMNLSAKAA